jgi:hypothetical protein
MAGEPLRHEIKNRKDQGRDGEVGSLLGDANYNHDVMIQVKNRGVVRGSRVA